VMCMPSSGSLNAEPIRQIGLNAVDSTRRARDLQARAMRAIAEGERIRIKSRRLARVLPVLADQRVRGSDHGRRRNQHRIDTATG
jgi:hypothetical protein